jgi:hypothetical protein
MAGMQGQAAAIDEGYHPSSPVFGLKIQGAPFMKNSKDQSNSRSVKSYMFFLLLLTPDSIHKQVFFAKHSKGLPCVGC